MPSEGLTFTLAVLGAATGGASTLTQVYTAVRDRPRLQTNFGITTRANGSPTIYIDVTNVGQRPTTVREVGFYAHPVDFELTHEGGSRPWAAGMGHVTFHHGPVFLEAGQSRRFEIVPNIDTFGVHADYPLRAYAVDIRGRRVWGGAGPVVRMLFGDNPPFRDSDPDDLKALFEPPRRDLRPWRVEPRWKVWKKRELRDPSGWRSPYEEK